MTTAFDVHTTEFAKDAARGMITSLEYDGAGNSAHGSRAGCDHYARQLRTVMILRGDTVRDLPRRDGASVEVWLEYAKRILAERD